MRLRQLVLVLVAVLVAALFPAAVAHAGNPNCFGREATILGTRDGDRLIGTRGNDVIVGGSGTDRIEGRGGNDRICGGYGEDDIRGGRGRDRLHSGVGDESGRGSHLYGGGGNDLLLGSKAADGEKMYGGRGNDTLRAFDSNGTYEDLLNGGPGDDVLKQGRDLSFLIPGPGNDQVDGAHVVRRKGDATPVPPDTVRDYLDLSEALGPIDVDLGAGTASGQGNDEIDNVEVVIGTPFDDTISGGGLECCIAGNVFPAAEYLYGMAGNDVLAGGEGDDCLVGDPVKQFDGCFYLTSTGEAGNDTLVGDRGDDSLWGLGGDDHYVGGPGEDRAGFFHSPSGVTVDLGSGQASGEGSDSLRWIEIVRGSQFDDVLTGDEGDNVLDGGAGADTLRGAGGNDALLVGGSQADTVEGGAGSDTAQYECAGSGIALQVDLQAGTDSIGNTLIEVENVSVGGCLATVAGDDGPNRIVAAGELAGRGGDDVLLGGYSDDVLNGGDGNDVLDGRGGTDACTEGETLVRCE